MSSSFKTILFDLDGTLVDTEPTASRAVSACMESWGIPMDPTDAAYVTGRTWTKAVEFFAAKYPLPFAPAEVEEKLIAAYRERLELELTIVPGAPEAVKALAERYPLALVSGSRRAEIVWALGKLGIVDRFRVILGAEDYPRSKPEPDGYLAAMRALQTEARDCLVFEDSSAGIQSARAAGAWVVAVTCTNHFGQAVSLAHQCIPDLRGVTAEWVESLATQFPSRARQKVVRD